MKKLLFVVNVDWFFVSHRLPIALEAIRAGYDVHIATVLTDQRAELESSGLTVHPLDFERGDATLASIWRTFRQLYRLFRSERPDLVHLVTIKPVLLGGIAARLARVPAVVAAVSGLGYVFIARGVKARVRRWVVGALYRLALAHDSVNVIFQNADDRDTLIRAAHLPIECTQVIRGSGVNLDRYRVAPLPDGPPIIVLAARLLVDKGVREFVDAARILRRSDVAANGLLRFALVGSVDPANPASLTHEVLSAWADEGVIELWGFRPDMDQVLSAASIVVLPSYREGLPKVLIEAAACARAVITTDVPGCRDAIEPGVTGLLVPVRDSKAIAQAIRQLLGNRERCQQLGMAGRTLAEREFDVRQVVAAHMQIYIGLLERGK
jgi:glycosyltransferase involved in cell wall biosynthesis